MIQSLLFQYVFNNLVISITADIGIGFVMHKYIAEKLGSEFYFAHLYSSWERGMNECTNRLIRQYIPKKQISMTLMTIKSEI
jgi:transposase, IS30 family